MSIYMKVLVTLVVMCCSSAVYGAFTEHNGDKMHQTIAITGCIVTAVGIVLDGLVYMWITQ